MTDAQTNVDLFLDQVSKKLSGGITRSQFFQSTWEDTRAAILAVLTEEGYPLKPTREQEIGAAYIEQRSLLQRRDELRRQLSTFCMAIRVVVASMPQADFGSDEKIIDRFMDSMIRPEQIQTIKDLCVIEAAIHKTYRFFEEVDKKCKEADDD